MKSAHQPISFCLATIAVFGPVVSAAEESQVVAQDLLNVRASNKVAAASGSRVLPLVDGRRMVTPPTPLVLEVPEIRVWLLRADGRQILPTWYTPAAASKPEPCIRTCEKLYKFSIVDSAEAVAMAIRIDDEYYIEKLESLVSRPAAQ